MPLHITYLIIIKNTGHQYSMKQNNGNVLIAKTVSLYQAFIVLFSFRNIFYLLYVSSVNILKKCYQKVNKDYCDYELLLCIN